MSAPLHPLLERLLRRTGASVDEVPSLDTWHALLGLIARTYRDADQDRYTMERAMDVSSREMQELYQELRRQAERELTAIRQSEERHRLMFAANPLPMWVVDAESLALVDVNDAMGRTYGYSRDELLRMRMTDLKVADEVPEAVAGIKAARANEIHHVGIRRHRRKDGTLLEVDITVHAVMLDGRRCVLGIAADLTQMRRVEEELRHAQKMEAIGRLAGGIAHDFNNILAVILANSQLALDDLDPRHAAAQDVAEIREAASRAAALTRQLLTFSRKQKRQPRPLALDSVVTGVERMLMRIVGEDIAMSAMIASDLGTIEADPGEVEQVLMNLVVNARDAMPGGGRLLLETANTTLDEAAACALGVRPGAYVVLAVTDNGCGMTEAVRARIFEPFFTTKGVDQGTGLGLAIVFGIVKESGGAVAVDSEPGRGTTFRVYWPRLETVEVPVAPRAAAPLRGSGSVLVVEDDPQLRHVLRRYLTSWGYTLLEAPNGAAALDLLRCHAGPIDLMLTDLVMPEMDGHTLGRSALVERPGLKVVYMSGYTEHAALRNAALGPEDPFVQKPFTAQSLSETLQRVLQPA